MNHPHDALFDDRIADWLEDDPTTAPRQLLETVMAAVPSIPQRRGGLALRALWSSGAARLAVAAVLAVALGLAGLSLLRGPSVGPAASPTPTPLPTAFLGLSGTMVSFTSPWYGYSIEHPAEWTVRPATQALPEGSAPWANSPGVDFISVQEASDAPGIIVAAERLAPGRTLDDWTSMTTVATCGTPGTREPIAVNGETGTLLEYPACFDLHHLWVTVIHGGTGFHIVWLGPPGTEQRDRALFLDVLASFRFPPAAVPSPTAAN